VIVDDETSPEKLTWRAGHEAHQSCHQAADVFSMRAETFERSRNIVGTLAAEADTDGIVVYGSSRGSSMKSADPQARWEAVEERFALAAEDRRVATVRRGADPPLLSSAAFHCQQAIEKLSKGFLTPAGKRSGKTHLLAPLGTAAEPSFREIADLVAAARDWSGRAPGSAAIGVSPRTSRTSRKPSPPSLPSPLSSWPSGGSPGRRLRSAIQRNEGRQIGL